MLITNVFIKADDPVATVGTLTVTASHHVLNVLTSMT